MNTLLFFIGLGTALLIAARLLKICWFVRLFFAACISWIIALIISIVLKAFVFTAGLLMIFLIIGIRLVQVNEETSDQDA